MSSNTQSEAREKEIMELLRSNPSKTYTEGRIRSAVTGMRSFAQLDYDPFVVNYVYTKVDEALQNLVEDGHVYKKKDGSETMYGAKMSRIEHLRHRIVSTAMWSKIQNRRRRLAWGVDDMHPNRIAIVAVAITVTIAISAMLSF